MATTRKTRTSHNEGTGDAAGRRSGKASRKPANPRHSQGHSPAAAASASPTVNPSVPPPRRSKKAAVLALLQRPQGAAIGELTAATGWQAHSVRAVLTGFRQDGKELARAKDEAGVTHYRLTVEA